MPAEAVYYLPTEGPSVQTSAMVLFAILCFPEETPASYQRRDRLVHMLRAYYVKCRQRAEGRHQTWAPAALRSTERHHIERALARATRLVNRRLAAAKMADVACAALVPPSSGISVSIYVPPDAATRAKPFSLQNVSQWMVANYPDDVPANWQDVKKRIWSPAKPVLHIAMALASNLGAKGASFPPMPQAVFSAPDWLPSVIRRSELCRALLLRLPVTFSRVIRLFPADERNSSIPA